MLTLKDMQIAHDVKMLGLILSHSPAIETKLLHEGVTKHDLALVQTLRRRVSTKTKRALAKAFQVSEEKIEVLFVCEPVSPRQVQDRLRELQMEILRTLSLRRDMVIPNVVPTSHPV